MLVLYSSIILVKLQWVSLHRQESQEPIGRQLVPLFEHKRLARVVPQYTEAAVPHSKQVAPSPLVHLDAARARYLEAQI